MTDEQIARCKAEIDEMNQTEMARLWRFAPAGHPYFDGRLPLAAYFEARFKALGGFTAGVSKAIGWGEDKP